MEKPLVALAEVLSEGTDLNGFFRQLRFEVGDVVAERRRFGVEDEDHVENASTAGRESPWFRIAILQELVCVTLFSEEQKPEAQGMKCIYVKRK